MSQDVMNQPHTIGSAMDQAAMNHVPMSKLQIENFIQQLHVEFATELDQINNLILEQLICGQEVIYEAGKYLVNSGGKRIRPLLTIIGAKLFNNTDSPTCIYLAAATEFIHAATLLHDDVVDSSTLRRFKPTVNAVWGNQEAVLVGDFLFSKSFQLMVLANSIEALKSLSNASSIIAIGEVKQLSFTKSEDLLFDESEYFQVIEAKTAELMAASIKVGAIIAGASAVDQELLYNYGKLLGTIFQIRDDMLDYFSSSEKIGKNIGDDFRESKVTLPLIYLHNQASLEDKNYIENLFQKNHAKTEDDFAQLINLMAQYDIEGTINNKISILIQDGLGKLANLSQKPQAYIMDLLKNILIFASEREN